MATFNIEILNPKAKKLLMDLADLRLISISESVANPFLDAVKRIRSKNAQLSLSDITKEVENIRSKRYGK
jgi:anti-anti-sigma regulatory factor